MYRALGLLLLLSAAMPLIAADPDYHLSKDSLSGVYAASAFAHGFRHGYEEGFHNADRDLHLSFFQPNERRVKVPGTAGYRQAFGSKESFSRGFESGYRAGYADSAAGISFRVTPAGLKDLASTDKDFDRGVQAGFRHGSLVCESVSQAYCLGMQVGRSMASDATAGTEMASTNRGASH